MHELLILLRPRWLSIRAKNRGPDGRPRWRAIGFLTAVGLLFWGGIFAVSLRVLSYFQSIDALGDILAYKLLSMLLITLFSLLIFSSILTVLSKLYLSRDLSLVHALPIETHQVFTARWLEATADSAWMVIIYTLPVFVAYGLVYRSGLLYVGVTALVLPLLALLAASLSAMVVMMAALAVPAGRIRTVFIFVGLLLFMVLFLAFRLLQPERLVDPEVFSTTLQYLAALKTPVSPLYPTTWAFDALKSALQANVSTALFHLALLAAAVGLSGFTAVLVADRLYFKGLSKSAAAGRRFVHKTRGSARKRQPRISGPIRAFAVKEVKTFFRDQTQWTQLFLIGGLVTVYIYNFSVLPLEKAPIQTLYLQNLLSFLNVGLAAFVLTAVTARFAFPAVSLEKEAIWLVASSPITKRTFLWIKFFVYLLPLLVLTELLIVATNLLLHVTPFMMVLSTITIFFVVPGVVALGIGLGAANPDYKAENPIQAVTSFGGFLFMVAAGLYVTVVIALEAGPVYQLFMAGVHGRTPGLLEWLWIVGSFGMALILSVLMVIVPMRYGERLLLGDQLQ